MNRIRNAVAVVLMTGVVLACVPAEDGAPRNDTFEPIEIGELDRFPGRLDEGGHPDDVYQRPPLAEVRELDDEQVATLLQRLKPLPVEVDDQTDFALRPDSQPPPRTGATIRDEFPPEKERRPPEPEPAEGPLEVLRYSPEGEVLIAGQVSLTFDRPMVAVTAHDEVGASPARLTPDIPGAWRWVGTRTLLFEPAGARLPMATEFEVSVPADVLAADGSELAEPQGWQFATPPPALEQVHPSGSSVGLEPLIFIRFDQRIDPDAMLETIVLEADGEPLPLIKAEADEIEADAAIARQVERSEAGRYLVVRSTQPLPKHSHILVRVLPGTPSAEGPRRTETEQAVGFRTYGPLMVTGQRCSSHRCSPNDSLILTFSNELATDLDVAGIVEVEPPIPDMHVEAGRDRLRIEGVKQGRTVYTVRLSDEITDRFGQQLEGSREFLFDIGSRRPQIVFPAHGMVVVDPRERAELQFFTANFATVDVLVHRVKPADWPAYAEVMRDITWRDELPELPGDEVFNESMRIDADADAVHQSRLDLEPWLENGSTGHLLVIVEPGKPIGPPPDRWRTRRHAAWVQVTSIGLDAAADGSQLLVWGTDLESGDALEGLDIVLGETGARGQTGNDGLALLPLDAVSDDRGNHWIEARHRGDVAILPETGPYGRGSRWGREQSGDQILWHVFDDRALYRPGESVHLKGWIRREERRPDGGLGLLDAAGRIRYNVTDSRGNALAEGQTTLTRLGGFDLSFELPDTPNLGSASVRLTVSGAGGLTGASHTHRFEIQEFRTPEFEVSTRLPEGPFVGNAVVHAEVEAAYYAGGPLAGADVDWSVVARPGHYRPPDRDEWTFGFQSPWWMPWPVHGGRESVREQFAGHTDGSGIHRLDIDLAMDEHVRPLSMTAQATVMDVNRQAWSARSEFIAHPSRVYVGLRTDRQFAELGEPINVELISVDLDGEVTSGTAVVVEAARIERRWRGGDVHQESADIQRCEVESNAEGLAECEFSTRLGGQYRITAVATDESGRRNASRIIRWVGGARMDGIDRVEMEEALLIPEREEYAPDETAKVLVQAPFENAQGLMTLRRHGLAVQRRFEIDGTSKTLDIPLRREWMPNVELHVTLVGEAPREDPDTTRPAIATGRMMLPISTAERSLEVDLRPVETRMAPGSDTAIDLVVRDAAGEPVADAEIALVVVDEAILALSNYELVDPLGVFYRQRPGGVSDHHLRPSVLLPGPPREAEFEEQVAQEAEMMRADGMVRSEVRARGGAAPDDDMIDVREDFNPLAAFVPVLTTDSQGRASASIQMPDNLTRYRVMAVAVDGATHYGIAESAITARLPLMVRPSAPRFLNFGDTFEFPVVLQNQTDDILPVEVALDVANLDLTGAGGYALEVPPNDRVEVRFPAGTVNAGTARYQVAAATGDFADAARGQMPVWTPATTEAFATYGVIDEGALIQPVMAPSDVWPQFGQLEITTSATALQSLTDAFVWLCEYPFQGTEPIASRLLGIAALADVLEAFGAEGVPQRGELEAIIARDTERLASRQNPDGGFGLWRRGQESWPFVTLHVAHALIRARDKGYAIDDALFDRTLGHVREIEQHIPGRYSQWTRRHIIAYSLYVRGLTGEYDRVRARALMGEVDDLDALSFESIGWLLGVMTGDEDFAEEQARLRRFLANRVTETAASAHFVSDYRDGAHLIMHSNRRADGIILEALIDDQPESDLIPKIVTGLQAHRTRGRWSNTQENAFVLLALDKYFRHYEDQEPDFFARAWLGKHFAGEHHFEGRTTDYHHIDVPMARVMRDGGRHDLILDKDGAGRLYYRVGLSYAPKDLQLDAASHGFEVERTYRGVDEENDVRQRADGTWEIRAGSRVEVELTLVAPTRRYHVALVDPLPAGLESINPALAVSEDIGDDDPVRPMGQRRHWWWGPWYEHQNLRDERTEAFAAYLPGGVYTYTYYARATTPGEFVVPPTRAEEMYHPETFGRSPSSRVIVTDDGRFESD